MLAAVLLLLCVKACEVSAFAPGLPLRRPMAAAAACRQAVPRARAAAATRGEVRMAMHGREMTERSEAVQVWHASARGALRALAPQRHTEFAAFNETPATAGDAAGRRGGGGCPALLRVPRYACGRGRARGPGCPHLCSFIAIPTVPPAPRLYLRPTALCGSVPALPSVCYQGCPARVRCFLNPKT